MLSEQNIESELSYAYLHAVASRAGFGCAVTHRHLDDAGVDARIDEDGRKLAADSQLFSFTLDVQLKATCVKPVFRKGMYSFSLKVKHYDKLRTVNVGNQRVLVVLFLPANPKQWLTLDEKALTAKRCAYWLSLRGAAPSPNEDSHTVYLPKENLLTPKALTELMTRLSREEKVHHVA